MGSDEDVTRFLTFPIHKTKEDTKKILDIWLSKYNEKGTNRFAIENKKASEVIGMIVVVKITPERHPEIGYVSSKKFWGMGYMTEACKAMVNYLFGLGYKKILIRIMTENTGANKVIEKGGFSFIKMKKVYCEKLDRNVPLNFYEIVNKN
ncbi:GNAT family N-acetyltransferase [Facklamia sp. DSM 111018]|uniref:GNAT family N-acetyltransferase n=1 Tax=Facklamia lactis TaxID=2749967 RepID=A0ABS0LNQ8_9LACT|nr:GNAT family N-acetyltransferase [Facklamia lactis]MBG9985795.1 GNAT family N-acetyltransferase [Facklamia lactis]